MACLVFLFPLREKHKHIQPSYQARASLPQSVHLLKYTFMNRQFNFTVFCCHVLLQNNFLIGSVLL
jgi:hypothetical protein